MTDTADTTATQPNVVNRVDELTRDAIASRDAVRSQLADLRAERTDLAAKIKGLVKEEEKLSRIVKNLERMSTNGDQ